MDKQHLTEKHSLVNDTIFRLKTYALTGKRAYKNVRFPALRFKQVQQLINEIRLIAFTLITTIFSCSEIPRTDEKDFINEYQPNDELTIMELVPLLNSSLSNLPDFNGYSKRDTILEGDDEVTWKGKAYYNNRELTILAEANWLDTIAVHRITVFSNRVKEGDIFVGQYIRNIRELISEEVPSSPDGYLFLNYKEDKRVSLQIDLSDTPENSPLYYGVETLAKLPDSLKVESIIVMN